MSDYGTPPPPPPPSYEAAGAQGAPPPNYLVWAILSTILCCPPFGIASIIFSTRVNSKWALGDVAGAQEASGKAKKFALWATISGVILVALWAVLSVIGVMTATTPT